MTIIRLDAKSRCEMIVNAAINCVGDVGFWHIDYKMVADKCEVATSEATVRRYFHTMQDLRDAVLARMPGAVIDEAGRE